MNTSRQNYINAVKESGFIYSGSDLDDLKHVIQIESKFIIIVEDTEENTDSEYYVTTFIDGDYCGCILFEGMLDECQKYASELVIKILNK